jgi:hypothetical protein
MNMLQGEAPKLADLIQETQFKIRVAEHKDTAAQIVNDILQMAGYSSETFGIYDGGGPVKTATEVQSKQQRSLLTRDRKIRLWRPSIAEVMEKLLAVDQAIFHTPLTPQAPEVLFADGVQESELSIAQTVLALRNADAASDEVIVGKVHPDWDEDAIKQEVALIVAQRKANQPAALPDPMFMHPSDGMNDGGSPTPAGNAAVNG